MNNIDLIRPKSKRVEVNGVGEWDWSNNETVAFTSDALGFVEHRLPDKFCSEWGWLTVFHPHQSQCVIGVYDNGKIAWGFRANTGKIAALTNLFGRDRNDLGFFYTKAFGIDRNLALIYEGGVLFFDEEGAVKWRQDHFRPDWQCVGATGAGVEYHDSDGSRWIYRFEDGARSEVSNASD